MVDQIIKIIQMMKMVIVSDRVNLSQIIIIMEEKLLILLQGEAFLSGVKVRAMVGDQVMEVALLETRAIMHKLIIWKI